MTRPQVDAALDRAMNRRSICLMGMESPDIAVRLMTPTGRGGVGRSFSFQQRPERACMDRLPDSLAIALWTVGSCWALGTVAYLSGASRVLILPLFAFGLLTGVVEWLLRRAGK